MHEMPEETDWKLLVSQCWRFDEAIRRANTPVLPPHLSEKYGPAFNGRKVLVECERVRVDAVEELQKIYAKLDIPVSPEQLQHVVGKHDWENILDKKKGASRSHRKASPGSWSEDLTSKQATSVEQITAPVLKEFYAE